MIHQYWRNVNSQLLLEPRQGYKIPCFLSHLILYTQLLKMELIQGSETSANYNLTPGKYPKEHIQESVLFPRNVPTGCRAHPASFPRVKRPGRDVKNDWSCTPPPPHAVLCGQVKVQLILLFWGGRNSTPVGQDPLNHEVSNHTQRRTTIGTTTLDE